MSSMPIMKKAAGRPAEGASSVLAHLRHAIGPRWQALAPRERIGLLVALTALAVLLVWMLGVAPALRTLRSVPAQRATLDAQYQVMRRQAAEAQQLRQQPPVPPGQAEAALKAATAQLGAAARLSLQPDRATVSFDGVDAAALTAWLAEVRTAARARVIDAQLTLKDKGYSGTVALSLQRP